MPGTARATPADAGEALFNLLPPTISEDLAAQFTPPPLNTAGVLMAKWWHVGGLCDALAAASRRVPERKPSLEHVLVASAGKRARVCGSCGMPGAAVACPVCPSAVYCGPACAKAELVRHAPFCKPRRDGLTDDLLSTLASNVAFETVEVAAVLHSAWSVRYGEGGAVLVEVGDLTDSAASPAAFSFVPTVQFATFAMGGKTADLYADGDGGGVDKGRIGPPPPDAKCVGWSATRAPPRSVWRALAVAGAHTALLQCMPPNVLSEYFGVGGAAAKSAKRGSGGRGGGARSLQVSIAAWRSPIPMIIYDRATSYVKVVRVGNPLDVVPLHDALTGGATGAEAKEKLGHADVVLWPTTEAMGAEKGMLVAVNAHCMGVSVGGGSGGGGGGGPIGGGGGRGGGGRGKAPPAGAAVEVDPMD